MSDLATGSVAFGQRPALIIVDMTNGFTQHDSPLGGASAATIETNQRLLDAFRLAPLPVCFTSVVYDNDSEASVFRAHLPDLNLLQRGTHWVDVDPRLEPLSNEPVFDKTGPSGFFGTHLKAWLDEQQVDSIIVTGLTTSGCVRATVVDGLHHNYPVWVVEDACEDRNLEAHKANLHDMAAKYASVKSTQEVVEYLAPSAELSDADYV
ncbi:isochorismatase family protein [Alteromonas sediminis]|uniref:Isochorismatase family protein n=1 Tax=Alteromonas sediminis TaxID=2259342 RepID=A0A3N5XY18_9ALTE|nr:isochorismatase family protein [Alteromonas sediminis]RPJ65393.1 isochorismatase family protein [Alteromonas sediminis]